MPEQGDSAAGVNTATPFDPATHSVSGKPHPQFILDYFEAFRAVYPTLELPALWDRGNGWVDFKGRSARKSEIIRLTERGRAMRRQCPHGEPLGTCADCVREHQEATR